MDPADAFRQALEELEGTVQTIDVDQDLDAATLDDILAEPGISEELALEAGYGTAAEVRNDPARKKARRSFMRSIQRYRDRGQAQRRKPPPEVAEAVRQLGLNVVRRRRTLQGPDAVADLMTRQGATTRKGLALTIEIVSGRVVDSRQRQNLPSVHVSAGALGETGFEGPDDGDSFWDAWLDAYGIGAATARVTDVVRPTLELKVGRWGRPAYESGAA